MATLKKNQINQVLFCMVDKTDFATLETSLASGFTVKYCGANHGAVASTVIGDIATASVVKKGSGFYKLDLTASQCNFDMLMVRIAHASAATQMLLFELPTYDDSDMYSFLSDMSSDIKSLLASAASDIISMLSTVSQLRVRMDWSTASDLTSKIAKIVWDSPYSNFATASTMGSAIGRTKSTFSGLSDILSKVYVQTTVAASAASTVNSKVIGISDIVSKIYVQTTSMQSQTSDIQSNLTSFIGNFTSYASDIASAVWAHAVGTRVDSRLVKVQSTASNVNSKLISLAGSRISGMSDILSKVYVQTTSMLSQTSDAQSKIIKMQSVLSDFDSIFKSRVPKLMASKSLISDYHSDIRSIVSGIAAAALTVQNISDISSRVWSYHMASQTGAGTAGSALNVVSKCYSLVSDITSALAITATASDVASAVWAQKWDIHSTASTFGSRIAKWAESGINIRPSDMSSISNYAGAATITAADMSNIASRVWSAKYTAHSVASSFGSLMSDIYSRVIKTQSTSSRVNSVALSMMSTVSKIYSQVASVTSAISTISLIYAQTTSIASAVSTISKIYSQTTSVASDVISMLSTVSQLRVRMNWSTASDLVSKIASRTWALVDASDVASAVWAHAVGTSVAGRVSRIASVASDTFSQASDIRSYLKSVVASKLSGLSAQISDFKSDMHSLVSTTGVHLAPSIFSRIESVVAAGPVLSGSNIASAVWSEKLNVYSAVASTYGSVVNKFRSRITAKLATSDYLSKVWSDLRSQILSVTVTVDNASIASAVWANAHGASVASLASQIYVRQASQYVRINGSLLSGISDILSKVYVDTTDISDVLSKTRSYLGSTVSSKLSGLSDIVSKVYVQTTSMLSIVSDTRSYLKSVATSKLSGLSDILSKVYVQTTSILSQTSDTQSNLTSFIGNMDSYMSDIASRVWATAAGSNVISRLSDLYSYMSTFNTDGIALNASGLSDVKSVVNAALDDAFVDATGLTANGLKDRIRTLGWVIRNKMIVTKATGNTSVFKDDNATVGISAAAALTSTALIVTRKRLA